MSDALVYSRLYPLRSGGKMQGRLIEVRAKSPLLLIRAAAHTFTEGGFFCAVLRRGKEDAPDS